jgi:PAS domain S-box-containing protein
VIYLSYVLPLFVSALVALTLGAYATRYRDVPAARPFAWAMFLSALWLAVVGLEVVATEFAMKVACHRLRTMLVEGVCILSLLVAVEFTGHRAHLTRQRLILLLAIPAVVATAIVTSDWHPWFRTHLRVSTGPIPAIVSDLGPLFYLHAAYIEALILAAMVLLVRHLKRASPLEAAQARLLLAGLAVPVIVDGLETIGIVAVPDVTVTPLSWTLTGILCAWALLGLRMFDVEVSRRTARLQSALNDLRREMAERQAIEAELRLSEERYRLLFETMAQGVVQRGPDGQVVSANPAALRLLGVTLAQLRGQAPYRDGWHMVDEVGRPVTEPTLPSRRALTSGAVVRDEVLGVYDPQHQAYRWLNVNAVPQFRTGETEPYQVFTTFEDITARWQTEKQLAQRVADQSEKLAAVYDVMRVADSSTPLDVAFENALGRILQAVDGQAACLHQIDDRYLRLFVHCGLNDDQRQQLERLPTDWLDLSQERIYLAGGAHSAPLPPFLAAAGTGFGAFVGAPIRVGGQPAGLLSLLWHDARTFTVEDIALLRAIAEQVGIILENIRLRERIAAAAVVGERRRLARDLHDSVTQSLHGLVLTTDNARALMQRRRFDHLEPLMVQLSDAARQALKEMRLLLYELRLQPIAGLDLVEQIEMRLDAVERRAGIDAQLVADVSARPPQAWTAELYPIIMEALNNALKHARATAVRVALSGDADHLALEIADNGVGFDLALTPAGGMGLTSMAERAERIGGSLSIETAPGHGTHVRLQLPRRREAPN